MGLAVGSPGVYGHGSSHCHKDFHCEGNIFTDFGIQIPQNMETAPRQHKYMTIEHGV